jgi:hypothetical protein
MKRFLLLALVFCMPSLALAQRAPEIPIFPLGNVISGQGLNAARSTGWIDVKGYKLLILKSNLTRVAAMAVKMTCRENSVVSDDGDPDGVTGASAIQVLSGTTSTDLSVSKDVSADKVWTWRLDVNGFAYVNCTFTATAGGVSDLLTVTATKARGE